VGLLGVFALVAPAVVIGGASHASAAHNAAKAAAAASLNNDFVTYSCTGSSQYFEAPYDVTSVRVFVGGAPGEPTINQNDNQGDPGDGGGVISDVPVAPGAFLTLDVGCAGAGTTNSGISEGGYGYTDGGAGGTDLGGVGVVGLAGGGSSAVLSAGSDAPLVVAGGGGGGGGGAASYSPGGAGGNGSHDGDSGGGGVGLAPAQNAPGGSGGVIQSGNGTDGQSENNGSTGGGGGGGGYLGGAGGGAGDVFGSGGGGGGGSSYVDPTTTDNSFGTSETQGTANPGVIEISYSSVEPSQPTTTFTCTGQAATYTVPDDVASLAVQAVGAAGAGEGAAETQAVDVTPGEVLDVAAGCAGTSGNGAADGATRAGGFGLGTGGQGGAGGSSGVNTYGPSGSGGGGSSGVMAADGTVLVEAAGGGGSGGGEGTACPPSPAPAAGTIETGPVGNTSCAAGGAAGAPGNDPNGTNGSDATGSGGGGGGGGSTYGPGGGGQAGSFDGSGASGGGGLSYPGQQDTSDDWGTGNADPSGWYDFAEPSYSDTGAFSAGQDGVVVIQPISLLQVTLDLTPATTTIAPGGSVTYSAEGIDSAGNDAGDMTPSTTFSIAPVPGGTGSTVGASCTTDVCTAQTPGQYTVTSANEAANGRATAMLTVGAGPPADLSIYSGNDQTITPKATFAPLSVLLTDSGGYAISQSEIVWKVTGGPAAFPGGQTATTSMTSGQGIAVAPALEGLEPGTVTVTASTLENPTLVDTFTLTVLPDSSEMWALPASSGEPTVMPRSPSAFSLGVTGEKWRLEVAHPNTHEVSYTGTLTLDQGVFSDVHGIQLETGDSFHASGGTITFSFRNYGGVDGVAFTTQPTATMFTATLSINGTPATAQQVYLGTSATNPTGTPVVVGRTYSSPPS
jgi:hypothetical protein